MKHLKAAFVASHKASPDLVAFAETIAEARIALQRIETGMFFAAASGAEPGEHTLAEIEAVASRLLCAAEVWRLAKVL